MHRVLQARASSGCMGGGAATRGAGEAAAASSGVEVSPGAGPVPEPLEALLRGFRTSLEDEAVGGSTDSPGAGAVSPAAGRWPDVEVASEAATFRAAERN